jgi:large subunit ribosomal protein L13
MKTYSPKPTDIQRTWYIVDAKGKTLGKMATKIADILRGKNKPTFSPHLDCGDFVIIVNAKDIKLTGNKLKQKTYFHHTRYPAGLRAVTAGKLMETRPEKIIEIAIAGMIPRNKIKKDILSKLKVYAGEEHKHSAQQPTPLEI